MFVSKIWWSSLQTKFDTSRSKTLRKRAIYVFWGPKKTKCEMHFGQRQIPKFFKIAKFCVFLLWKCLLMLDIEDGTAKISILAHRGVILPKNKCAKLFISVNCPKNAFLRPWTEKYGFKHLQTIHFLFCYTITYIYGEFQRNRSKIGKNRPKIVI